MTDTNESAPAAGERIQRYRFRVVAPDGRELVSDVVAVRFPPPPPPAQAHSQAAPVPAKSGEARPPAAQSQSEDAPAAAKSAEAPPPEPAKDLEFPVSAIYVAVCGQKQGAFRAETKYQGRDYSFGALSLEYEVRDPIDLASGQRMGKRQHHPVSITRSWGAASPQLFQALVTNEALDSVEIDCYGRSKDGKEELVHKLKLTNASISTFKQQVGAASEDLARRGTGGALETVAFAFQKIEHLSPKGDVVASDALGQG